MDTVDPKQILAQARSLHHMGHLVDAARLYRMILQINPMHADATHLLGVVALQMNRFDDATRLIQKAIALNPTIPDYHSNLGAAYMNLGRLDDAAAAWKRTIELDPNAAQAYSNLGIALGKSGHLDDAIAACQRAIQLKPTMIDAHCNLGVAYREKGDLDRAVVAWKKAMHLSPDRTNALNDLAVVLGWLGRFEEAEAILRKMIHANPSNVGARWNLALSLLKRGEFAEGWKEYEWRRHENSPFDTSRFPHPQWRGEDITGRTILLHTEQGFGDAIQFVRYLPMVAQRGANVYLFCSEPMERLFAENFSHCAQVTTRVPARFDLHCSLMSLPGIFQTTLQTIPADIPYIHASPARIESWKKRFEISNHKLRVGVAWAGRPTYNDDANRSIPSQLLLPLASDDISLHSLQLGPASGELASNLIDHAQELTDFSETAAMVHHLDLVISVDTAAAHLAGAMGKPCWLLLPSYSDWRWLIGRQDSPWYPTLRLYQQTRRGDWPEVIARVATHLRQLVENRE